ncbi:MAG: family 10 glycosylhydrolase, partial [Chitinophagaceae bacterium]|nr:family 10 glycosylhydrolase [Chitinophagaceae bacterium]
NGSSNYDDLYADIRLWLQNEWIDYVTPQLYWQIGHRLADYTELVEWWNDNAFGRQLYIGHGYYRYNEAPWRDPKEIPRQIQMLREYENVHGSIYFSSKTFEVNPHGWNDSLRNNYYRVPALIPPMRWIDGQSPPKPLIDQAKVSFDGVELKVAFKNKSADIRNYAFYYSTENNIDTEDARFIYALIPAAVVEGAVIKLPVLDKKVNRYMKVTAIDVNNNESEAEELVLFK